MKSIVINEKDSVGVALADIYAGEREAGVLLADNIPMGHKFALSGIKEGGLIYKYGQPIGSAACDIQAGSHVHTHNVRTNLKENVSYRYEPVAPGATDGNGDCADGAAEPAAPGMVPGAPVYGPGNKNNCFMGYIREDGAVGARNEIWIIPTVGCVNKTAEKLAEAGRRIYAHTYAFMHPYGCSQLGTDHRCTQTMLAGLALHPNAGGVLVVGLGCENNSIDEFKKALTLLYEGWENVFDGRIRFLNTQDCADELSEGSALLDALAARAGRCSRSQAPLSALRVGLKCGGSDGLSGITANPLVGEVSDRIVMAGGAAILAEVPEMFGAEHLLMNRCENEELFNKTVSLINDYKNYYIERGQNIYENPSPGNKAGGISTLEDKSLGCTQKGGKSRVRAILRYGDTAKAGGLNLLEGPGNDLIAVTALTCAGAQLILFTTGRGTPVGAPVPTLKISSNSDLAGFKSNWIDFDAGRLTAGADFESLAGELYDCVIALASGDITAKNELNGYREISLFKDGVIL